MEQWKRGALSAENGKSAVEDAELRKKGGDVPMEKRKNVGTLAENAEERKIPYTWASVSGRFSPELGELCKSR